MTETESKHETLLFITVSELKQKATQFVTMVEQNKCTQIIITKNGKLAALLRRISENELKLVKGTVEEVSRGRINISDGVVKMAKTKDRPKKK